MEYAKSASQGNAVATHHIYMNADGLPPRGATPSDEGNLVDPLPGGKQHDSSEEVPPPGHDHRDHRGFRLRDQVGGRAPPADLAGDDPRTVHGPTLACKHLTPPVVPCPVPDSTSALIVAPRLKVNPEQEAVSHRMKSEGAKIAAIGRATGLSRPTVYSVLGTSG
jgi:hypothetical protein